MAFLAAVLVFVAVAGVLASVMTRAPEAHAIEQRLADMARAASDETAMSGSRLLRRGQRSGVPALRRLLEGSEWSEKAWRDLQQAGLALKVGEYLILRLMFALFAAVILLLIVGAGWLGFLLAIVAAVGGSMVPALYVRMKRDRRRQLISKQMVEALQLMSNALRSGFAFTQAVEMAAKQLSPPIKDELEHFLRDHNLGARVDDALQDMAKRTGSMDVEMLVTTIMVQRITGGNLSEVLDNVAETVRERQRLQGEIQALTGQQRLTGLILSIYPAVLLMLFLAIAPSIWGIMFTDALGRIVLGVAVFLQLMGILWIRQVLKLDV